MIDYPRNLPPDPRAAHIIAEDQQRANKYAEKGTVMHFAHRLGFFPHNEEQAEGILKRIIAEHDWLEQELERERKKL